MLKNWTSNSVTPSTMKDIIVCPSNKTTIVIGVFLSMLNANGGDVKLVLTDAANTALATLLQTHMEQNQLITIDTKFVISQTQKVRLESSVAEVALIISGDES